MYSRLALEGFDRQLGARNLRDAARRNHFNITNASLKQVLDCFINTVFNHPMFAECYEAVAFNGLNRLS